MRKCLLTVWCAVLALGTTVARADVLVAGKTLTIKDNVTPTKKKVLFLSKDPTFAVGSLDPTAQGASLTLSSRGCTCFGPNQTFCFPKETSSTWLMPALGWVSKKGAFSYKDKLLANGPVLSASIKNGQIKISAKGSQIDYGLLNFPGQAAGVRVQFVVGSTPVCALFPGAQGSVKKDDPAKGVYTAGNAEAPAACTDPVSFCQAAQ